MWQHSSAIGALRDIHCRTTELFACPSSSRRRRRSRTVNVPGTSVTDEPEQPDAKPPVPAPRFDTAKAAAAQQEYWEQRKRPADTEVMTKIWGLPRWTLWSSPMEFVSITAPNSSRPRTCDQRECGSNTLGSANRLSTGTSRWPQKLTLWTPVLSTRSDGSCSNPGSSFTIARSTGSCNSGIARMSLKSSM